ncbi:MAG TPA: saccharopine dehydrogenase NADP-binding domain-containing protein [Pseudonocardiaceae bacterium]|nr:saccharopine dehydrogenase NADP-binding domain-containing protein [Pseudonocardiaceae bacterium]
MTWMVYGAYGYTGELVAKQAVARGELPVLAGRSAEKLAPVAERLGCPQVVVALDDRSALRAALADVDVVAHCAGPFARTSADMVDACLDTGTHYLDITGEIDVFEAIYARHDEAEQAGVVLLPGGGFDVVPTDCLAAMLAERLPGASELELAFTLGGGISGGTLKTAIEGVGAGGRARVDGELRSVPLAHRTVVAEFPSGPKRATAIPWGDVSSAFRSTGIPTVTTYMVLPGADLIGRGQQYLTPLLAMPSVRKAGAKLVDRLVRGPSEDRQAGRKAEVWGRVKHPDGHAVSGALTTPAAYRLTADAVVRGVARLVAGGVPPGAHTPSSAFGSGFVAELDGVHMGEDLPGEPPTEPGGS